MVAGATAGVFDPGSPAFVAQWGRGSLNGLYDDIFELGTGRVGACVTNTAGQCSVGVSGVGKYLVIAKEVETSATVYSAKTVEDFVDTNGDHARDLGTAELQVIRLLKKDGSEQWSGAAKDVITGSYLEITRPDFAYWDAVTGYTYPFIFSSDSNWDVDVCAQVPQGYAIVGVFDENGSRIGGTSCVQTFVAGGVKVVAFEVVETGSPEPELRARLRTRHNGRITTLDLNVPGLRRPANPHSR